MWVDLQIKNICDSDRFHTEDDIRAELGILPKDLSESYSKIFQRILSHPIKSRQLAIGTLSWIMWARSPLSTDAIIDLISGASGSDEDNPTMVAGLDKQTVLRFCHTRVPGLDKETILRFCHNLVVWDRGQDKFRFAHLSVGEFLENEPGMTESRALVAETCLLFLCSRNSQIKQRPRQHSIYIDQHWSYHIRSCGRQREGSHISRLLMEFFKSSTRHSNAYVRWATQPHRYDSFYHGPENEPLFTAVSHGLTESVQYLLTLDAANIGGLKNRALVLASQFQGSEISLEIVRLLLKNGAEPTYTDNSALSYAIAEGHDDVVQLLLDRGSEGDRWKGGDGSLQTAAGKGYQKIVQMLLVNGPDQNNHSDLDDAMFEAVKSGHEQILDRKSVV